MLIAPGVFVGTVRQDQPVCIGHKSRTDIGEAARMFEVMPEGTDIEAIEIIGHGTGNHRDDLSALTLEGREDFLPADHA